MTVQVLGMVLTLVNAVLVLVLNWRVRKSSRYFEARIAAGDKALAAARKLIAALDRELTGAAAEAAAVERSAIIELVRKSPDGLHLVALIKERSRPS